LKQPQFAPLSVEHQVIAIYAVTNGYFDKTPVDSVQATEIALHAHIDESHVDLIDMMKKDKSLSGDIEARIKEILTTFFASRA
jgi:F-type H+-transporting ATPase subunit alpha